MGQSLGVGGAAGFGAGAAAGADSGGGGGGLGAGGDIFVQAGGSLTIAGASTSSTASLLQAGTVVGGKGGAGGTIVGGAYGQAYGNGIFIQGGTTAAPAVVTLGFGQQSTDTTTISGAIADQTGSGGTGANAGVGALLIDGAGTVALTAANTFTGGVTVAGATLSISSAANLGASAGLLTLDNGATLDLTAAMSLSNAISLSGAATFDVASDQYASLSAIADGASPGSMILTGGGQLSLFPFSTNFTGGVTIEDGSELFVGHNPGTGAVTFGPGGGEIDVSNSLHSISNTVNDFGFGDLFDLASDAYAATDFVSVSPNVAGGDTVNIETSADVIVAALNVSGSYLNSSFALKNDGSNHLLVTYTPQISFGSSATVAGVASGDSVTLSGADPYAIGVTQVEVFNGTTEIGLATLNAGGTWSLTTTLANGTYSSLSATATGAGAASASAAAPFTLTVAGNVVTQVNADGSKTVSTVNIPGEAFTSDMATYSASSQFVSEVFYAADGSAYFDYAGPTTVTAFETYQAALDLVPQGFVISDSAKDVSGDFDALNGDTHINAITLTDSAPVLTLTVEQALDDTAALHAITNASYHIDIVDTASDLEALLNTQITALASEGVTELTASDANVAYSGQQTAAILAAGLTVAAPANDKVVEAQAAPLDNYSYFFGPTGALTKFATYHADKTSEIIFYTPGTFEGIAYVNSDETLDANGNRASVKYYSVNPSDPGGPLIVRISQTVEANGVISVDFYNDVGVLLKQQNNQNGVILDTRRYTAGSAFGVSYASCDVVFNALGKVTARTYYDAGGDALVTQTFTSNGYTLTAPDGTVTYTKAVDSDGNYETGYYGDTAAGQAFESNQFDYNSAGVKIANSFDTQTGNGQLNLIGDGLVASTLEGTVGPTTAPGDFTFTPHTTGETYNFFSSATNDVVDFTSGFGTAIVKGFAGTNAASDVLNLSSLFGSLGAAQTATQVLTNGNTTITAGTDVITLVGVTQALTAKQMGFA